MINQSFGFRYVMVTFQQKRQLVVVWYQEVRGKSGEVFIDKRIGNSSPPDSIESFVCI